MIILQKNSFRENDLVTNAGFAVSVVLLAIVFLVVPLLIPTLGFDNINPVLHVLLPSLIIIPVLSVSMYFVGKPGRLFRKFRLKDLHPVYIFESFLALIIIIAVGTIITGIYVYSMKALGIEMERPVIEAVIKNSGFNTLLWLAFGIVMLAPISEELVFRRFIFGFLAPRVGFAASLVITAGVFSLIHFSWYSLPGLFLLGIGFQLIYLKFGSIYPAIIMHALNNAFALCILFVLPDMPV